ncbi:putative reverse transcriptase domain-containing protein [Tanacetum coccineum]
MAPRGRPTRTTRSRPVTTTPPPSQTTTHHFGHQCPTAAMIDEGVMCISKHGLDGMAMIAIPREPGTEEVVNLTQWFERMETVFRISNCTVENQVKFATCTLMGTALTWWTHMLGQLTNEGGHMNDVEFSLERLTKFEKDIVGGMPDLSINTLAESQTEARGSLKTLLEITKPNNQTKGRTQAGLMLPGTDRSFVSTQFSTLINIAPTTLDHGYNVELADGRIIWVNTVLLGCTLNFLNHPFHVDLMPVEMGTYDVIIGMDWLTKYQAVIDCAKKIVRIPFGSEILIFHGDGSRNKRGTRLNIISCTKAQKYLLQGCHVFLAHITIKETGDKSKKKQLQDVSIVKNFPKVFPEDLPGLPHTRQVEFHIDLVPGAAPVARAPYRLAPSEMKELADQLQELSDKGFIRPSSSPWGAPVLFVKKKDGSLQMCIDYRELNKL